MRREELLEGGSPKDAAETSILSRRRSETVRFRLEREARLWNVTAGDMIDLICQKKSSQRPWQPESTVAGVELVIP